MFQIKNYYFLLISIIITSFPLLLSYYANTYIIHSNESKFSQTESLISNNPIQQNPIPNINSGFLNFSHLKYIPQELPILNIYINFNSSKPVSFILSLKQNDNIITQKISFFDKYYFNDTIRTRISPCEYYFNFYPLPDIYLNYTHYLSIGYLENSDNIFLDPYIWISLFFTFSSMFSLFHFVIL